MRPAREDVRALPGKGTGDRGSDLPTGAVHEGIPVPRATFGPPVELVASELGHFGSLVRGGLAALLPFGAHSQTPEQHSNHRGRTWATTALVSAATCIPWVKAS